MPATAVHAWLSGRLATALPVLHCVEHDVMTIAAKKNVPLNDSSYSLGHKHSSRSQQDASDHIPKFVLAVAKWPYANTSNGADDAVPRFLHPGL